MFMLSFSISFVCLVVTLLILCVILLLDPAPAHSPSDKQLNPTSQGNARFSARCILDYKFRFILSRPSVELSNSSLTLWWRGQSFLSGRYPFFRALHLAIHFSLYPDSSCLTFNNIWIGSDISWWRPWVETKESNLVPSILVESPDHHDFDRQLKSPEMTVKAGVKAGWKAWT